MGRRRVLLLRRLLSLLTGGLGRRQRLYPFDKLLRRSGATGLRSGRARMASACTLSVGGGPGCRRSAGLCVAIACPFMPPHQTTPLYATTPNHAPSRHRTKPRTRTRRWAARHAGAGVQWDAGGGHAGARGQGQPKPHPRALWAGDGHGGPAAVAVAVWRDVAGLSSTSRAQQTESWVRGCVTRALDLMWQLQLWRSGSCGWVAGSNGRCRLYKARAHTFTSLPLQLRIGTSSKERKRKDYMGI